MFTTVITAIRKQGVMPTPVYEYLQANLGREVLIHSIDTYENDEAPFVCSFTVPLPPEFKEHIAVVFPYSMQIDATVYFCGRRLFRIGYDEETMDYMFVTEEFLC